MITFSDPEYHATKRIKQGKDKLKPPLDAMARWIEAVWQVTVLNVIHEGRTEERPPRLEVIVEHKEDLLVFRKHFKTDQKKAQAIMARFRDVVAEGEGYDTEGLFVIFSAFAPLALQEADNRVGEDEVTEFQERIANPELWKISRCFGRATFFFYTAAQAKAHEAAGKKKLYATWYLALLKKHDEFGYLDEEEYEVNFDSKEILDRNFQGSFFYYYR